MRAHRRLGSLLPGRDGRGDVSTLPVTEWHAGFSDGALVAARHQHAFTHVEIWHIALNMFALYVFGPALEGIIGRTRFLAVYLVGATRRIASMVLWSPLRVGSTVGASGAIFALLGGLLVARKARLNSRGWCRTSSSVW